MDSLQQKLIVFLTASGAAGIGLANWPVEYSALIVLMSLDILTGIMCGFVGHRASSDTLKKGIKEKVGIAIAVALIHVLQLIGVPEAVSILAVYGFIAAESLSLIENLDRLGVPIPNAIKRRLERIKDGEMPDDDDRRNTHTPHTPEP